MKIIFLFLILAACGAQPTPLMFGAQRFDVTRDGRVADERHRGGTVDLEVTEGVPADPHEVHGGTRSRELRAVARRGDEGVARRVAHREAAGDPQRAIGEQAGHGRAVELRRHATDDSVFLGDDYLIKGVAGAILWKLASDYNKTGRTDFSNRELRLDPTIGLPDVDDNLEARLILLRRRLEERDACLRIEKTGRGRFRLVAKRPLQLREVTA